MVKGTRSSAGRGKKGHKRIRRGEAGFRKDVVKKTRNAKETLKATRPQSANMT